MLTGSIVSQGKYADGKDMCELYISRESSCMITHEYGKKLPILINIGNTEYIAGVHETQQGVVWISSVLNIKSIKRERFRLVDALEKIGLETGCKIKLIPASNGSYVLKDKSEI